MLALALGLIAAAPQLFDWFVDRSPYFGYSGAPWCALVVGKPARDGQDRNLSVVAGPFIVAFYSRPRKSTFVWGSELVWPGPSARFMYGLDSYIDLPPASTTLRIACAVTLGGVWLLVVGGRMLARKWTRNAA